MSTEIMKAFEETTTRNVKTMIEYSKNTRDIVRECEKTVAALHRLISQQDEAIGQIKRQLQSIQTIVFKGGTS